MLRGLSLKNETSHSACILASLHSDADLRPKLHAELCEGTENAGRTQDLCPHHPGCLGIGQETREFASAVVRSDISVRFEGKRRSGMDR